MVKAQEYLEKNYPQEERKNTKELNLRQLNLTGDLDLEGFNGPSYHNPLRVYLTGNPQLGAIKNKPRYTTLIYQNPQESLNHQYPHKNQVTKIDLISLIFDQPNELIID